MSSKATNDLQEMVHRRKEAVEQILTSPSRKKLIIAGPGTGKTFTFKQALARAGGRGLALTFIRNLVRDLQRDLVDVAEVYTFHGFCKHLLHRLQVSGLTSHFDFYPSLFKVAALDRELLGGPEAAEADLARAFHQLDDSGGLVSEVIALGNYYDAAGFIDLVYRVLRRLEEAPSTTPSYPLLVVDEYQDFSRLETTFISRLADASPVLIAGDDDQALYAFKHASASYIRDLAGDTEYERFGLPYCSRCTDVIVQAVNAVIARATKEGHLRGRLDRELICFLPEKGADSARYLKVVHARCSIETGKAQYLCRYVAEEISKIPAEEIADSHDHGFPTALVIGPMHFVRRVHDYLTSGPFPAAKLRQSEELSLDLLDGYRRIAHDTASRLGWRIIVHCCPFPGSQEAVADALRNHGELMAALQPSYQAEHLFLAGLVSRLTDGQVLPDADAGRLSAALGRSVEEITDALRPEASDPVPLEPSPDPTIPSIVCTSLVGAKGLSAGHVFIVGFNDGHFPQHPMAITDEEICCFVVALSRTRKVCHLVSCRRFGAVPNVAPSSFLAWIKPFTETRFVDKGYWASP